MHYAFSCLRSLLRLVRKLLVNGLFSTIKRLLLQGTLAAVTWAKKTASKPLRQRADTRELQSTPPEIQHDSTVICYSQEPKHPNIQPWAESTHVTTSDVASGSKAELEHIRSDTLVASPEIESQPFNGIGFNVQFDESRIKEKLDDDRLWPIFPEHVNSQRYQQKPISRHSPDEFIIQPMTVSFCKNKQLPYGWVAIQHPEGALYFYHQESKAFTDVDLYNDGHAQQICSALQTIEDICRARSIDRTGVDTVLGILDYGEGDIWTGYYFAKHATRSVFFLHSVNIAECAAWEEVKGAECPTHIAHEINAQYWTHCIQYPNSLSLTPKLVDEFKDMIIHYMGDTMLSQTSTVPYSVDDLQKMLTLANHIRKNTSSDNDFHGSSCVLSGFMMCFARTRFYNFHGQHGARLERDKSVHSDENGKRSWVITLVSPLLFCAPDVHLRGLEKIWIDDKLSTVWWNQFMAKLYTEWQEFVLYGTVLLNANVAFLAIQSVDQSRVGPSRSLAQIASYASVVASTGCIILGLVLIRSNRSKAKETALEAAAYMSKISKRKHGLESFSIMVSLPYAMLMWATAAFLVAFVYNCFDGADLYTRVLISTAGFALACLISWCVYMQWEKREVERAIAGLTVTAVPSEPPRPVGRPSKLVMPIRRMSTSLKWPTFLQGPRRSTVDSDRTAV